MVIRSSTRTTRPAANSRAPPGTTSSAPARFARRERAPSPAWSATARRCRSTGSTRAGRPARRSRAAAASATRRVGSCPRARTARREDGTGTNSSGSPSTGAWEDFRPDAGRFPKSVLGKGNGWDGERW
ncbi:hypothetical protein ACIP27_26780, partial [Streptomyces hydrogenans]